jgi:hypothetical protein
VSTFEQSGAARGDNNSHMGYYRFVVHDEGQRAEDPGVMELVDDADAQSFANGVIRDLMQSHAGFYFGWTLDITDNYRALASIPFEAVKTRH